MNEYRKDRAHESADALAAEVRAAQARNGELISVSAADGESYDDDPGRDNRADSPV